MSEFDRRGGGRGYDGGSRGGRYGGGGTDAGKRTLTEGLKPGPPRDVDGDAVDRLDASLRSLDTGCGDLETAIGAHDFDRALSSDRYVGDQLATLDDVAAEAETAGATRDDLASRVSAAKTRIPTVKQRAKALRALAPEPGPGDPAFSFGAMGFEEPPERVERRDRWLAKIGAADAASTASPAPGAASPDQGATAEPLPHRAAMEQSFGRRLGHVEAHTGRAAELGPLGAQAVATGNSVTFADAQPSEALVAHEVTHVVQNEQAGTAAPMAAGVVAPRESAAEAEADANASLIGAHGGGFSLPPVSAPPAASVHLSPNPPVANVRLDLSKDAAKIKGLVERLRIAFGSRDEYKREIVEILQDNADPERMYALHRAYGSMMVPDIEEALDALRKTDSYWARARVYLGEQMSLDAKIGTRGQDDIETIMRDLERVADQRVLDLFQGASIDIAWSPVPVAPAGGTAEPTPTWLPATTTLAAVKDALHGKLSADNYYRAMRLLLDKADRALAAQNARAQASGPPGADLGGFTITAADLTIDPTSPDALNLPVFLSPMSQERVDLAEQRVRAADASGDWLADPTKGNDAELALADLNVTERRALAMRLHDKPLTNALGGRLLGDSALEVDDAAVIARAVSSAQLRSHVQGQALHGVGLDFALARAGDLVRAARAKLAALPPDAPDADRKKAQAEVQRLESLFFGQGSGVLDAIRDTADKVGGDDGIAQEESQLRAAGADGVTIAAERLRVVQTGDADALIAALRKIAAEDRLPAMQRSGQLESLWNWSMTLTEDQRDLLSALLWQGTPPPDLTALLDPKGKQSGKPGDPSTAPPQPPTPDPNAPVVAIPPDLGMPLVGPSPEITIALHDILDGMDHGAFDVVLSRLSRLSVEDQQSIFHDPRYRAKFDALPAGSDPSDPAGDMKTLLRWAEQSPAGARQVLLDRQPTTRPLPGGPDDAYQRLALESMGAQANDYGQANMRRAYVLVERLGGRDKVQQDPTLLAGLSDDDRKAVEHLISSADGNAGLLNQRDGLSGDNKETASQIIFGQPQLTDTADAALDPNTEAEFMFFRLREAAGIRDGVAIVDWVSSAGPSLDESVAEFLTMYQRVRPGGVNRGDLAQLAELYHRALRRVDAYRKANDSFASTAAQVVGAVVATVVVTIASGGTLGPVAIGALAAVSGAAASAATGAAIRIDNTTTSVLKDAGTGAVEGIAAAAGAGLAAKIVRGATMGMSAGRAAASIGAHAAGHATGGIGASIAEAAIDGAIGNAAGDLFQTATDEATWDRGIAEAFATMLAALARGAATGAAFGGAIGGIAGGVGKLARLASKLGDGTARDLSVLLESAGVGADAIDHLSDHALDELGTFWSHLQMGSFDEAERALSRVEGLPPHVGPAILDRARARVALESLRDLGPINIDGVSLEPQFKPDHEFRRLAGTQQGDAVILIEDGKPRFIAREGAPVSSLREEYVHLSQWANDPAMRMRMQGLSEDKFAPATWKKLPAKDKLELHLDKLEVEADAQRRIIADLSGRAEEDTDAALRVADANETLNELGDRIDKLHAARGEKNLNVEKLGIEDPPRMYAKGSQTPKRVAGVKAEEVRTKLIGKRVEDVEAELKRYGYSPHKVAAEDGSKSWRLSRKGKGAVDDVPHLTVDDETGLIREVDGRPSFAEQKTDAAREWDRSTEDMGKLHGALGTEGLEESDAIAIHRAIQDAAPRFRAELEKRLAAGTLDKGGAGLLMRWGDVVEELDRRGLVSFADSMKMLPQGAVTKAALDDFRRALRRRMVDEAMRIPAPERMEKVRELIALQPDNASGGHLFTEFREEVMERTMVTNGQDGQTTSVLDGSSGEIGGSPVFDVETFGETSKPGRFTGKDLAKTRQPDGVTKISAGVEGQLPGGRYAIEDKTGPNAFDIKQAEDYARRSDPDLARRVDDNYSEPDVGNATGGFKLTPDSAASEYDGVVYVFSGPGEAKAALKRMRENEIVAPVLEKHPGGIHVMYMNDNGELTLMTNAPERNPT